MRLSRALRIAPGDVLALIGGGGKTTAMFRLADELANTSSPKMRVLMTTSTRIFAVQIKLAPAYVTFDPQHQAVGDILPQLDAAVDKYGQVLLIGQTDSRSGKAFGIPPKSVDILAGTGHFDLIINEADGSRMRSFKAPADHEPVIPSCTTVVTPVVGLDVLGQPLTDETVHRANLVSKLSNTVLGQLVTADMIVAVMCHRDGGLKNIPTQARVVPLLNKVESPADLPVAQELATRLLACDRIEAVAIGAVQSTDRPITAVINRTAAIILAAGGSSRFGSPKQLARWKEQTFLERAVDVALASQARPIIVVLGAETDQCHTILKDKPVQVAVNKDWASGQSSSMKAGLAALPPNVSGVVFQLVDLPGISSDTINALIQRYRATLAPVVWPEFEGRRGNPVLFDRSLFPELMQVRGDTGGRPLLVAYQDQAERISVGDQGILIDIDRAEDMENYLM
jgi:molybdenum cofactor cytidylyltransferase